MLTPSQSYTQSRTLPGNARASEERDRHTSAHITLNVIVLFAARCTLALRGVHSELIAHCALDRLQEVLAIGARNKAATIMVRTRTTSEWQSVACRCVHHGVRFTG